MRLSRQIAGKVVTQTRRHTAGLGTQLPSQLGLDRPRPPWDWFLETVWEVTSPLLRLALALAALAGLVSFVRAVWNSWRTSGSPGPWGVRLGSPGRARDSFGTTRAPESSDPEQTTPARGMDGYWDYALAAGVLNVFRVTGYLFALRALLVLLFRPPRLVADAFPLLIVPFIPIMGAFGTLAYDYPQRRERELPRPAHAPTSTYSL